VGRFVPDLKNLHRVDGCWFVGRDLVYREYAHKVARWRAEVRGLEGPHSALRVEGNLFSFLVFPFETVYQLVLFKLGAAGLAFVHALGAEKDGTARLLIGRSGIGKSTLGGRFLRDGHRLLGDDTVLLDAGGTVWSFPVPIGLRSASMEGYGVRMGPADHALLLLTRLIKGVTLGRISLFFKLSALRLGPDRLARRAPLGRAVFALPGPDVSVRAEPDPAAFARRAARCSRFEFVLMDKLLEAYAYVFPASGVDRFFEGQEAILRAAFARGRLGLATLPGTLAADTYPRLEAAMAALDHG
jgi:hypothetical protein